jgi:hypothetical protein
MAKKLLSWFKYFLQKRYKHQIVNDVPDIVKSGIIYIIKNNGYPWQIVMLCPCGCKKNLHMNLVKEYYPYWKFKIDKRNKISLSPSVHRIVGCKSHFFVRYSKIVWA